VIDLTAINVFISFFKAFINKIVAQEKELFKVVRQVKDMGAWDGIGARIGTWIQSGIRARVWGGIGTRIRGGIGAGVWSRIGAWGGIGARVWSGTRTGIGRSYGDNCRSAPGGIKRRGRPHRKRCRRFAAATVRYPVVMQKV